MRYLIIIVAFAFSMLTTSNLVAQNLKKAFELLDDKKYEEAKEIFNKAVSKKKETWVAKYGLAMLYADTSYSRCDTHKAYLHFHSATKLCKLEPPKERENGLEKYGLSQEKIIAKKNWLTATIFSKLKRSNDIESFNIFIANYKEAEQYDSAVVLRDKLALDIAIKANSYFSFHSFLNEYPGSIFGDSAKKLFDSIALRVYNKITYDGEYSTLTFFEENYPDFPFPQILNHDKAVAALSSKLFIWKGLDGNEPLYDKYIRAAAPKELAFVALQRLAEPHIIAKDWQKAADVIKKYKTVFPENDKRLNNLINILERKEKKIVIEKIPGGVNTQANEYIPVLTGDCKTMYFCGRKRPNNIGGEDIFVSNLIDNKWDSAQILQQLNTPFSHEAPLSISIDGTEMLLFANGNIYSSRKTAAGWSKKEALDDINSENWEADAMLSSDGNALIFVSNRAGKIGRFVTNTEFHGSKDGNVDIYVVLKTLQGWSKPINIGETINTPFCERGAFLHPDMKTLYFSSDGHGGLGRLDIFKTTRLTDSSWTQWSEPENLGKQINTHEDDFGYRITTDGLYAYFTLNIENNLDIYYMELPAEARPEFVATVQGRISNTSNLPIEAKIRWENLTSGESIGAASSSADKGEYFIVLPLGKNYGYFVEKEGYYPVSSNIDLRDKHQNINLINDITLISLEEVFSGKKSVPLKNLFFDNDSYVLKQESYPELKRLSNFITQNNNLIIEISGHTDNNGAPEYNKKLSDNRANAVRNFLIEKGCKAENMRAVGYGQTAPVASNNSVEGRAQNRRVEFKVLK